MSKSIDMAFIEAELLKPRDMASIEAEIKNNIKISTQPIKPKKKKVIYSANVAYPGMFKK